MFKFSKIFKKSSRDTESIDTVKTSLKDRYYSFQKLLETNNQVLEIMADMEEKLSGEYLFDMHYIKTKVSFLREGVFNIIEKLNELSKGKYSQLYKIHEDIQNNIEKTLFYKLDIPVSDFAIPLEKITGKMVAIAGGKIAHLGEIRNHLTLTTPEGFTISSYAFLKFLEHNKLKEKIDEKLSALNIENLEEVNKVSKEIYDIIIASEIPDELESDINNAYNELSKKIGTESYLSVRSSAIREDSEFSFAGQYATFLNVPGESILQKYKEVVASLFTPRAIFYYKTKGFSEDDMVMAVGVLGMVDAVASGVMYTRDPNNPESDIILLNAVYGLGKWVVDGTVTPDSYIISRNYEGNDIRRKISNQGKMLICKRDGEIEEVEVPDEKRGIPCLSDEQIRILARHAMDLEKHYGTPQDIEWAIGSDNRVYLLQTRPLRTFDTRDSSERTHVPTRIKGYNVLLDKGVIACKGIGFGKAFILESDEDLKVFPEGGVLITKHTNPKYVTIMNKAAAIVTDVGSATGHMASLSREYRVPTILDTEVATHVIENDKEITVDAINCNIYAGRVDELIEYAQKKRDSFKDTHLFRTLEKVLKIVVPLYLVDPDDENFKADNCRTFHDITRFAHEIAMQEMFNISESHDLEETKPVSLAAGIPIDVLLLDLEGGIKENVKKATPDDVLSIPFSAILNGMKSMKWPEPPSVDARGFLGMLAHTASVPEDQLYEMGKKSFCIMTLNYMNFSIRLGYHFSLIEAYAGENINDNYIKFFFKGGGAAIDRRLRRVRLIKEILKKMGFRINLKEDVIDAILTKYKQKTIEEKLETMGKLTAYTKQLDMVMFNDAVTDMYVDQFIKEHIDPSK